MKIISADLEVCAVRVSQYPTNGQGEFFLCGRSNVGKSSFINTLVERKNLAHVSSNPGKTQTLNFYRVNNQFYLVDVPGYGYANTDRKTQEKFGKMIEDYLSTREVLKRVFLLVDAKVGPTEDDVLMYNYLKYYSVPVTVIGTKTDKVGGSKKEKAKKNILDKLDLVVGDNLVMFSANTKEGLEEVYSIIESNL